MSKKTNLTRFLSFVLMVAMLVGFVPVNKAEASGGLTVGDVPIGSIIVDAGSEWEFKEGNGYTGSGEKKPIEWLVVARDHYRSGETTVITDELIGSHIFDNSKDRGSDYGSNHWGESGTTDATKGIRKFLNGSSYNGDDKNEYDVTFYDSFGADFKRAVIETELENVADGNKPYTTKDKVWLPSQTEIGLGEKETYKIGEDFGYFTDNASRIAKIGDYNHYYWTRSPHASISDSVRLLDSDGSSDNNIARNAVIGVRPALHLKSGTIVQHISGAKYGIADKPLDSVAPTIDLKASTTAPTNSNVTLTITSSDESGVKRVQKPDNTWVNGSTTTHVVSTNGTYTFKAEDNAGNVGSKSITVSNIDKVLPVITVATYTTTPTNKDVVVTAITNKGTLNKASHTFTENGSFEFVATDAAGNTSRKTVTITNLDKIAPTKPSLEKENDKITLIPGTDSDSGIDKHLYSLNSSNWLEWDKDIDISGFEAGNYSIRIKAIDKASNESEISELNFTIESTEEPEEDTELQEAIVAVEKAEGTIKQEDVNSARILVNKLKASETKTQLNERLDDVQALIDYAKLLREATEAVERAEATQNQSSVNLARTRVGRLSEGSDKAKLHARLDIVQRNIDAMNSIGDGEVPEGDIEDYPPAIREEIENLQSAIEAVEKAESTELQEDVDSARILVNKLNPGKGKNDLNARLNEVQRKIDYAKLLGEATEAVEKAEDTRDKLDIRDAYSKVNRLSNGQEKTALLNRLKALEDELIKEEEVQKEESGAIRAVEIAEIFKGREPHLSRAQEKVDNLEEGVLKGLLQERLDRLTGKNSSGNEFDDPKYISNAERMVKQAEIFKREPHIGNAKEAVDKLSEGEVKDDFNRRLNALEGKSGSGSGLTFEQQVKSLERFVSQAEAYRTESRVEVARDKVNEMEDSIEKVDFLDRLDEIAVR